MKRFLLFIFAFSLLSVLQAQTTDPVLNYKLNRISKIYRSLEYNTMSFNDLKQTWIVTDPVFVREIFNRFLVQNALLWNGRKPTMEEVLEQSEFIYNGNVFIDLRKRYYDDEVEIVRFFKETRVSTIDSIDYFFDPVHDCVAIRGILGEVLYTDLRKQGYALNDITKTYIDYKPAYNFIIDLYLFEPEVMFWNATTKQRNKYLVSLFGKWGNDHVTLPGWYHPDYVFGLRVNYVDSLENNKQGYTYIGELGAGIPAIQPDLGFDDAYNGRLLEHTGSTFYFRFIGSPFKQVLEEIKDVEIELAGLFTVGTKRTADYNPQVISKIYSTRNYFNLFFNWKNLTRLSDFGTLDAGVGISAFDIKYFAIDPAKTTLSLEEPKDGNGYKFSLYGQAGLRNLGSLLTHAAYVQLNYNFSEKLAFAGVKFSLMITNTFGFDFRVLTPIQVGSGGLPAYRSGSYLVFSPKIIINY